MHLMVYPTRCRLTFFVWLLRHEAAESHLSCDLVCIFDCVVFNSFEWDIHISHKRRFFMFEWLVFVLYSTICIMYAFFYFVLFYMLSGLVFKLTGNI